MLLSLSLSIVDNPQSHLLSSSEPLCDQPQQFRCPWASGHRCCHRLKQNGKWLSRFNCPLASISLWGRYPHGREFEHVCELQCPKWWQSSYWMQTWVELSRVRNRRCWWYSQTPCNPYPLGLGCGVWVMRGYGFHDQWPITPEIS